MSVQKRIPVRQMNAKVFEKDADDAVKFNGTVGALANCKAGDVIAKAFGPLTYVESLPDTTPYYEFGKAYAGLGVLVNSDDTPFLGGADKPFGTTNKAMPGQAGAFMTYGICVVQWTDISNVVSYLNARVLWHDTELAEVELTGLKNAASTLVTLTITTPSGGTIEGAVSGAKFVKGDKVTLKAVAAANYEFSKWTVNSTDSDDTDEEITLTLDTDTTVVATFGATGELDDGE